MKIKLVTGPEFVNACNPLGIAALDAETGEEIERVQSISFRVEAELDPVITLEVLDVEAASRIAFEGVATVRTTTLNGIVYSPDRTGPKQTDRPS